MTNDQVNYDLEERTAKFGEDAIKFCRELPKDEITRPLINQLVKCGTSVGANYCEADDAESSKDFVHKIGICKKESRECKHFLRMIASAVPERKKEARDLWREANELNLIFNAIYKKVKNKNK
ncbi:MAG: four helix bundle protein [Candidatus Jacksonbacteria bacterium RIFOXYD2_FULL_43_21]|nr:MAG: four helix bundle protein [Candidatus Jacksonbacteria bacterium RIFOXYD2_FULL_43_21]